MALLNPSLYQINTRILIRERSDELRRPATLDDIPDAMLDRIAELGFDWVWLLGVWQTGAASRDVSRRHPDWRLEYLTLLPDCTDDDISGSPFAIEAYRLHADFGPPDALARARSRLAERGLRLLVDFVPNHTALDHPWAFERPELYIHGSESDLELAPQNYVRVVTRDGDRVLAYGRDPYFPGWPDTLQLNYRHGATRDAMREELVRIASVADGVRCDMAMLLLPEVIAKTWGDSSAPSDGSAPVDTPFWPEAIAAVHEKAPGFLLMAEVYWDLEHTLQAQGFDYTYDKRHYDRLHAGHAGPVRGHLRADAEFQRRSARFLENHDEARGASAFRPGQHEAAAILTFFVPGLAFFHEGQLEGRRARVSMHLGRRLAEPRDVDRCAFYERLLRARRRTEVREGRWQALECRAAWDGNATWDQFVAFVWHGTGGELLLGAVNFGPNQGQCYVDLPFPSLRGSRWRLSDVMSDAVYDRDGGELVDRGLYLDMPAWGYHLFEVVRIDE